MSSAAAELPRRRVALRPLPLAVAVASVVAALLVRLVAFHLGWGERADAQLLSEFTGRHSQFEDPASALAALGNPLPFALMLTAIVVYAAAEGRRREAAIGFVAALAAAATTQVLKPLLAFDRDETLHPRPDAIHIADAAWPSGHTTAAVSLAIALVLAVPRRARPVAAAVGLLFSAGMAASMLVLGWHYPSDAAGAVFVSVGWASALLALSRGD